MQNPAGSEHGAGGKGALADVVDEAEQEVDRELLALLKRARRERPAAYEAAILAMKSTVNSK